MSFMSRKMMVDSRFLASTSSIQESAALGSMVLEKVTLVASRRIVTEV